MARARNIKPGFFLNEQLAEIEPLGRLLFEGLWCIADRRGRLQDRPKRIKVEVLPYDECDVDALLETLTERGFLIRYGSGDARYIQVTNFEKHQNPHKNEAESTIPPPGQYRAAPEEHSTSTVQAPEGHSTNPADSLIPDSLIPDSLIPDSLIPDSLIPDSLIEGADDAPASKPRHLQPVTTSLAVETAEVLVQAPWVGDELPVVIRQVERAFELAPGFKPRDGPLEAEAYTRWRGYRKKPPDNWYIAWLKWIKKARDDAETRNRDHPERRRETAIDEPITPFVRERVPRD